VVEVVGAAAAHGRDRVLLVALVRARDAAEPLKRAVRHHPHRVQPGVRDHLQPLQQALVGGRVRFVPRAAREQPLAPLAQIGLRVVDHHPHTRLLGAVRHWALTTLFGCVTLSSRRRRRPRRM